MKQQARKSPAGHGGRRVQCGRCKKWRNVERCKQVGINFVCIPCTGTKWYGDKVKNPLPAPTRVPIRTRCLHGRIAAECRWCPE